MDLSFQPQEVLQEAKAIRGTGVSQVLLALWVQSVHRGKKANMDFLVVQEGLVCLEEKETKEILLACWDHLVLLAHLDPREGFWG